MDDRSYEMSHQRQKATGTFGVYRDHPAAEAELEQEPGMEEVEDYYASPVQQQDYYSNQAGDNISSFTLQNYRRSKRTRLGLKLVSAGILLITIGILTTVIGKRNSQPQTTDNSNQKQPYNPREPDLTATTRPPTAVVEPEELGETPSPTKAPGSTTPVSEMELYEYLSLIMGDEALKNEQSVAHASYKWLDDDDKNWANFSPEQILQRFSLACVYLATHSDSNPWKNTEGWMSSANECEWHGITCDDRKEIVKLNLTDNGLSGVIPQELSLLSKTLLALDLSGNPITNGHDSLSFLGELVHLKLLNIQDTLVGSEGIPTHISSLTKLGKYFAFSSLLLLTKVSPDPLTHLRYLEISENSLNSTIPLGLADLPNLQALYAYKSGITGKVEDFLPRMKSIFEIWLDDNYDLGGTIPTEVGMLTTVASLSISNAAVEGPIPSTIGLLTNMQQLWLYGNYLSGEIPSEIGALSALKIFAVEDNEIMDTSMPSQVCDLDM
ncbi:MAG: hypothetical protein SGILL_003691, partial [Bacillariaceae sp.]